jgi:hypothetical protein
MGRKSLTDFPWENPIPTVSLDNWITNLFRRIHRTKSESADYPGQQGNLSGFYYVYVARIQS